MKASIDGTAGIPLSPSPSDCAAVASAPSPNVVSDPLDGSRTITFEALTSGLSGDVGGDDGKLADRGRVGVKLPLRSL